METRNEANVLHDNNSRSGVVNGGRNGMGTHPQQPGYDADTHHNGVNTHTDKEGRRGITWVKIVSAYVVFLVVY